MALAWQSSNMEIKHPINNQPFFCSWSGGKDSSLALYHAIRLGGKPQCLFTMMAENGIKSHSHGLAKNLIQEQALKLGLPVVFGSASWENYEKEFISAIRGFREQGITSGVFGDIDIDPHREWVTRVCTLAGITPFQPLWKRERRELLREFVALGFQAFIIVVKQGKLAKEFLGRKIDGKTIAELVKVGVDVSGELGEYHTVVTAGPLFSSKIVLKPKAPVWHQGYWILEMEAE
jgi:diphthine-ammonia ligase